MAARCASCCYPLSVSDSVSCCECLSYFHIDCAQLVGFPYYELSSEPIRNTFHCQTCKILPLPRQSDSFSDSDSDCGCTMPSRQLDYHLEGQPDFAKDMNEIKGTVQDLSELCKDMFREINELKSINLTLRCCVENLRHDSEQRDGIISDLKRRIEALEGRGIVSTFKPINTTDIYVNSTSIEKEEEVERYVTPDPEYSTLKENENVEEESLQSNETLVKDEIESLPHLNDERITPQNWKLSESATEISDTEEPEVGIQIHSKNEKILQKEDTHFVGEEIIPTATNKVNDVGSVKDWDWRGDEAVPLNEINNESSTEEEEDDDEEEENEASDIEEAQGWEILDEDVKSESSKKHYEEETTESTRSTGNTEDVKRVIWADEVDRYDEEDRSVRYGNKEEAEDTIVKSDSEYLTESVQAEIQSRSPFEQEEAEENKEEVAEGAERTSLKDGEEGEEKPKLEGEVEIVEGEAEVEGKVKSGEETRLEGEPRPEGDSAVEEGAVPEGEAGEGGQSPVEQGEVQPSELSEGSEPPPPPQPLHTPDDLWEYLKETVTGEHPATVEEFVQKLIGTLEHVPEEYLKPVIDYNIKRANSPSVTDGEHLDGKEGDHHLEGEGHEVDHTGSGEGHPQENSEIALEGELRTTSLTEGGATVTEGESAAPHEDTTNIPVESSESAEGYSALEAAA